jgi:hypothetical protein
MRLAPIPENPVERVVARLNLAPRPLIDTQIAFTLARLVMVGTKLGVFEALREQPLEPGQVAERCQLDPRGAQKLLFALAGAEYVEEKDGRYDLAPVARKWLLVDSPNSLVDKLLFQFHEWDWMERAEDYVRTGEPLELHTAISGDQWPAYQRGMRSLAGTSAGEAARRLPIPKGARNMLDIGGSHGYYSVALCRRHERMNAVVVDQPPAVEHAAPILGPRARRPCRASPPTRRCLRDPRRIPFAFGEGRGPNRSPARLLLRPHQPVGHLVPRGDVLLAAGGGTQATASDPLPHRSRARYSGGEGPGLNPE